MTRCSIFVVTSVKPTIPFVIDVISLFYCLFAIVVFSPQLNFLFDFQVSECLCLGHCWSWLCPWWTCKFSFLFSTSTKYASFRWSNLFIGSPSVLLHQHSDKLPISCCPRFFGTIFFELGGSISAYFVLVSPSCGGSMDIICWRKFYFDFFHYLSYIHY